MANYQARMGKFKVRACLSDKGAKSTLLQNTHKHPRLQRYVTWASKIPREAVRLQGDVVIASGIPWALTKPLQS